jgi:hypothetical protein
MLLQVRAAATGQPTFQPQQVLPNAAAIAAASAQRQAAHTQQQQPQQQEAPAAAPPPGSDAARELLSNFIRELASRGAGRCRCWRRRL